MTSWATACCRRRRWVDWCSRSFTWQPPSESQWSDKICIALQLVEHLQDIGEDARAGRIYMPLEDLQRFDCRRRRSARLLSESTALRDVVAQETERTRDAARGGAPLASSLPLRARLAVTGFVGGGLAVLDAIERANYDVSASPASPTTRRHSRTRTMASRREHSPERAREP